MGFVVVEKVSTGAGEICAVVPSVTSVRVMAFHGPPRARWPNRATMIDRIGGTVRKSPVQGSDAFWLEGSARDDAPEESVLVIDSNTGVHATRITAHGVQESSLLAPNAVHETAVQLDRERVLVAISESYVRDEYGPIERDDYWLDVSLATAGPSERRGTSSAFGVENPYRAPGSPYVSNYQHRRVVLPALADDEQPIALGRKRFLTERRVFDLTAGGVEYAAGAGGRLTDLSIDERFLIVARGEELSVIDLEGPGTPATIYREAAPIACARFAGPTSRQVVLGTSAGDVVWLDAYR